MKVLICGSRDWTNKEIIKREIESLHNSIVCRIPVKIECIIHGSCRGADLLAAEVAQELDIPVLEFPADWKAYGKSAGPKRNQQMLDEGKPDLVLAFHDDIDGSKGTKDMVLRAKKAGVTFKVVREIWRGSALET